MISFVWTISAMTPRVPFISGAGGSEMTTLGYARELNRRGVDSQVITFGPPDAHRREPAPDVQFLNFERPEDVRQLSGHALLLVRTLDLDTVQPAFHPLWLPPFPQVARERYIAAFTGFRLVTQTEAMVKMWSQLLDVDPAMIGRVPGFAEPIFSNQSVPDRPDGPIRVLFAGRLTPNKGFYTLLEALHAFIGDPDYEFSVLLAGSPDADHLLIRQLAEAHPQVRTLPGRPTAAAMAMLLVTQDVVVVPSHPILHPEPFGGISVEAQHAGCRVVASDLGGLPETDCGGLHLFPPGNPYELGKAIRAAGRLGRLHPAARARAARRFTVEKSVDQLLAVLNSDTPVFTPMR